MKKHKHAIRRLAQALAKNTKVTHFSTRKVGKRWLTRSAVLLALAGGTGIVATINPSFISTIAQALTLPPGNTQI